MVGLGGLPIAHDDVEDFEGGPGTGGVQWIGRKGVRGSSWAKMPLLTIGLLGAQIVWSTEMGYASPYLLSLGLSKSLMSVVFVAGPLSGLIVQPLIGVLADNSTSQYGRRRPYMLLGSLLCAVAMLILGFTSSVASWFATPGTSFHDKLTIWFAVLSIYIIDFSINAVQAADRALLVDTLPSSQQERGNAWAGRMLSFGSVIGFWVGNWDLPTLMPWFGRSQLQVLCVLTSLGLLAAHALTCFAVKERVLVAPSSRVDGGARRKRGAMSALKDIWENVWKLPRVVQQICLVQFFAWIGWFPVLFFSTVYIGDIYTHAVPPPTIPADTTLSEQATRVGFRALLFSALIGLATIIILPIAIARVQSRMKIRHLGGGLAELWCLSQAIFAFSMTGTWWIRPGDVWGATIVISSTGFCFAVSQWVPFSLLGEAILSEAASQANEDMYEVIALDPGHITSHSRSHDIGIIGTPRDEEQIPLRPRSRRSSHDMDTEGDVVFDAGVIEGEVNTPPQPSRGYGNGGARREQEDDWDTHSPFLENGHGGGVIFPPSRSRKRKENIGDKAGVVLGIHNVAIVVPQFLVTGVSSLIFAMFDGNPGEKSGVLPGAGHAGAGVGPGADIGRVLRRMGGEAEGGGSDATGFIFRIGGFSSLIACILCWRLARELRRR